jgi:hypothetical protein
MRFSNKGKQQPSEDDEIAGHPPVPTCDCRTSDLDGTRPPSGSERATTRPDNNSRNT